MGRGSDGGAAAPVLTPRLLVPVAAFAASRLVTLAVAHAARLVAPQSLTGALARWDGIHYLTIADSGYPATLPSGAGDAGQSVHAFFPVFPFTIRAVARVTGLATVTSGLAVALVAGTAAAVLLWLFTRDLAGEGAATAAVLLFSFFPGSFVLTMVYSEGVFLVAAVGCLWALHRRWWVAAGLAAAVGGATRPTGLVLAACCAWAAVQAVRHRREWWALAAPALAPLGFVAWSAFLAARTGSALSWERSEERGWGQRFDFGDHTVRSLGSFLAHPIGDFNRSVSVLAIAAVVAGLVLMWRWRPPTILWIYTAGVLVPTLFSATLTSTPRFALSAFPLFMAAGRSLTGDRLAGVLAVSGALLALLMFVSLTSLYLTP